MRKNGKAFCSRRLVRDVFFKSYFSGEVWIVDEHDNYKLKKTLAIEITITMTLNDKAVDNDNDNNECWGY